MGIKVWCQCNVVTPLSANGKTRPWSTGAGYNCAARGILHFSPGNRVLRIPLQYSRLVLWKDFLLGHGLSRSSCAYWNYVFINVFIAARHRYRLTTILVLLLQSGIDILLT